MNTITIQNRAIIAGFEKSIEHLLRMEEAYRSEIVGLPKGSLAEKMMHGSKVYVLQYSEAGKKRYIYVRSEDANIYAHALKKRKLLMQDLKDVQCCILQLKELFVKSGWQLPAQAMEIADRQGTYYSELPFRQDVSHISAENWLAVLPIIENLPSVYPKGLVYRTEAGEMVRSKFEVIVANLLHAYGIEYHYELSMQMGGKIVRPDFVLRSPLDNRPIILECVGMLHNPKYLQDWLVKSANYAENGFLEGDNLILAYDNPQCVFNSAHLHQIIKERFFLP